MATYTQRGAATVNGVHWGWPLGKIAPEIISIRTRSWHVTFDYRTSMLGETACFAVQEGADGFTRFSS